MPMIKKTRNHFVSLIVLYYAVMPEKLLTERVDVWLFISISHVEADLRFLKFIKDIKINSISLNLNEADSINFASFSSASLQIVGSNTGMQTIAIKNPISSKTRELALQVSDEVKIVDYFKSEKFSLVLDLDFIDESYDEGIGAMIVMDLTIKYN